MRKIHRYTIAHYNSKGSRIFYSRVAWFKCVTELESKTVLTYAKNPTGVITRNVAKGSVYIQHDDGYTHISPIYG